MRSNGKLLLYDILNLSETVINEKRSPTRRNPTNPSPGTGRSTATGFETSVPQDGREVKTRFSLKEPVEETKTLRNAGDHDTIGAIRHSLKEDLDNGRARKETRAGFLRRATGEGYTVFEGDTIACGYRTPQRVHQRARQIQEELTKLGIESAVCDGKIIWNLNGISSIRAVEDAVTVEGKQILVSNDTDIEAKNAAGHEAFHFWKGTDRRDAYIDIIEDNLRYDSTFAFPVNGGNGTGKVRAYDAELLIRNASDGKKYLYDIVNLKENTIAQIDLAQRETRAATHKAATGDDVSKDSLSQGSGEVKEKFSLKGLPSVRIFLEESFCAAVRILRKRSILSYRRLRTRFSSQIMIYQLCAIAYCLCRQ